MAQDAGRVPAWRRLGLALKNGDDQSGVAVTESQTSIDGTQPSGTYGGQQTAQEQFDSPNEPAVNGKSSRLGKRKHQHEPAEHHHESKKSRIAATEGSLHGASGQEVQEVTLVENAKAEVVTELAPTPAKAQSKGDSNYRKKKEKPNKRRRDNQHVGAQDPSRASHGSALSPGEPVSVAGRPTLLASTESDQANGAPIATPQRQLKKSSRKDTSGSPPQSDRRKSVAFTPDTKTSDGNTGQDYFKAWVAEQKGTGAVSQPPEVSNFVLHSLIADEEKTARRNGQLEGKKPETEADNLRLENNKREDPPPSKPVPVAQKPTPTPASTSKTKAKKKDPSVYISYLTQYHTHRDNWKFNKAKQNDVVDNALNIFRIPDEHSTALIEYVAGLQGAGVIERLRERCSATLKDLDDQDAQMDDEEARKVAKEEAEQERIAKERERRKTEGDVASLAEHPYSAGFIRRLQRRRAKALLNALGRAAPVSPAVTPKSAINPLIQHVAPPQRDLPRKRKRRTEVSSDESSSDSSSDEESSSSESDDGHSSAKASTANGDSFSSSGAAAATPSEMSLASLPTELVERIASHLDLPTCRAFRLTSTSLSKQTLYIVKDRFFRQRTLKWTTEDFSALLQVTAHATFGDALQTLIIDATPRHSIHLWQARKRISEAQAISTPYGTVSNRSELEEKYATYSKIAEDAAVFFNETRYDQKSLRTVFQKIKRLDCIAFAYNGMDSNQHEMSRPFVSTMSAIAASNCQVRIIVLDGNRNLAPSLRSFDAAFERLEILQLHLRDWRYADSGFELDTARAPFVELELSCYSSLEADIFGEMARHCAFERLEICRLSVFRINAAADLSTFLAPASKTLKSLRLHHILLSDPENRWPALLCGLAKSTHALQQLRELDLENLFNPEGSRMWMREEHSIALQKHIVLGLGWRDKVMFAVNNFVMRGSAPAWGMGVVAYPFEGLRM
ncbi:hypothetical protein BDW02DRAFT_586509 [Decorospora gaudefroyi]|uniref:F-box domain-containing protein n=1 Tax=Decorospora gaudefroyi TaxID=184978 RepID=A0A6A5KVM8_9PLEO|nr:hypothetical protein BDW02DRAFT_586509 [Decorospora gaudefroyi]